MIAFLLEVKASTLLSELVWGYGTPLLEERVSRVMERWDLPEASRDTVRAALVLHLLLRADGALGVKYVPMDLRGMVEARRDGRWVSLDSLWVRGWRYVQRASKVDRIPRVFFRDLLSPEKEPIYRIRWDGDYEYFYSFGWCSELEMAYVVALSWLGIRAKVVMPLYNHVRTAVWVGGRWLVVDNMMGEFMEWEWEHPRAWAPEVRSRESIRLVKWYNRVAREGWDGEVPEAAEERLRRVLGGG